MIYFPSLKGEKYLCLHLHSIVTYEVKHFFCLLVSCISSINCLCISFVHLFLKLRFSPLLLLFIWLCCVLVAACGVFSCGMWDLIPWSGVELGPSAMGEQTQPLDHQRSPTLFFFQQVSLHIMDTFSNTCCKYFMSLILSPLLFSNTANIFQNIWNMGFSDIILI